MNLDRMLIDRLENRILVGIVSFVAIMVIVGWIAINETARMAAFADQFEGRSIERGALLFNQNCSECHGTDGLGLVGIAPALDNPHLFGHDFFAAIDREVESLERELANAEPAPERVEEIEARIQELADERAAIEGQMGSAIEAGYDPTTVERTAQVAWEGSLRSYVYTTLVHGRPGSNNYWPQGMAAWAQTAGGPLRDDQVEDLTSYIMNWDREWTIDDLNSVNQFAKVPADASQIVASDVETVGVDVDMILTELANYTGDPVNGQALYNGGTYACSGCHMNAVIAPLTEETWPAAVSGEGDRPYSDEPLRYVVESIVLPNDFIVAGYNGNQMPQNFGDRMTYQDMADINAYLQSYDG